MSEPFVGEIRLFAGNFAPRSWAFCHGQLIAISSNEALYSLLGSVYGGDDRTTFNLPDLRGRIPIHYGTGPGLANRPLGSKSGSEYVSLTRDQIPSHGHSSQCSSANADSTDPTGRVPAKIADGSKLYDTDLDPAKLNSMAENTIRSSGSSLPHQNMMPSLGINFIIAQLGIYPSRN